MKTPRIKGLKDTLFNKNIICFLIISFCALALVSCTEKPMVWQKPEITFSHIDTPVLLTINQSYVTNIANTQIYADGDGITKYPLFSDSEKILTRLIRKRVSPMGGDNALSLRIEEASITEEPLKTDDDVRSIFKNQNSQMLTGEFVVYVELLDELNRPIKAHRIKTKRQVSILSDVSVYDKKKTIFELGEKIINEFDEKLTQILRAHYI